MIWVTSLKSILFISETTESTAESQEQPTECKTSNAVKKARKEESQAQTGTCQVPCNVIICGTCDGDEINTII